MTALLSWIAAHWATIAAILAVLISALGTVRNLLTSHPVAQTWLGYLLDVLSWVSAKGSTGLFGRFNPPPLRSVPIPTIPAELK